MTVYSDDFSSVDTSKWSHDGATVATGKLVCRPAFGASWRVTRLCPNVGCDWSMAVIIPVDGVTIPADTLQSEVLAHLLAAHGD